MSSLGPNLFIVGAAKCGTTSVYRYLNSHPAIFMSARKEPHHFSRLRTIPELQPLLRQVLDDEAYLNLFAGARDEIWRGEASTSYLWDSGACERIEAFAPEARIIILLRDPVERALSHYMNNVGEQSENRPFDQAIREELEDGGWDWSRAYVGNGRYVDSVRAYFDAFPDRVYVGFAEELASDTAREMSRIFAFLGVDPDLVSSEEFARRWNVRSLPRGPVARGLLRTSVRRVIWKTTPAGFRSLARRAAFKPVPKPAISDALRRQLERELGGQAAPLERIIGRSVVWASSVRGE